MNDLQKKKLARYFLVYDVDEDGHIAWSDFERVLENVRELHGASERSPAHVQLREAFRDRWDSLREVADADESGSIELWEWLQYFDGVLEDDDRYEAEVVGVVARLFEIFDTDEDGTLGPDEFCNFYGVYGLSAALARQVFFEVDTDRDGRMSRAELRAAVDTFFRGEHRDDAANLLYGPFD